MRKKIIHIIFLTAVIIPAASFAKVGKKDSILNVLKKAVTDDSNKVNLENLLFREFYYSGNYSKADSIVKEAIMLAGKINFKRGEARAYSNYGNLEESEGNYTSALEMHFKALKIDSLTGDSLSIATVYGNIGMVYEDIGNYPEALRSQEKSLIMMQGCHNKLGEARADINIGVIFHDEGNSAEDLKYQLKALRIDEALGDKKGMAYAYGDVGNIYKQLGNYSEALKNDTLCLNINIALGEKEQMDIAYGNIASVYDAEDKDSLAIRNYILSLKIADTIGDKLGVAIGYNNLGEVYFKLKNYTEAIADQQRALKIDKEIDYEKGICLAQLDMAKIFERQEKYDSAQSWIAKGLLLAKKVGNKEVIRDFYNNCAALDSTKGNFGAAYSDYKMFIAYRDSMNNEANTKKIVSEQMTYEFDKKEALTKAEHAEQIKKQRIIIYSVLAGLLLVLILAITIFRSLKIVNKARKRSDELLLNILPEEVAEELKEKGTTEAKSFDEVTVMFTDFKGFTTIAEKLTAKELVAEIDYCFKGFDNIIHKYGIEKIKTIGDSYMAASGLPIANKTHAKDMVNAALEIVKFMEDHKQQRAKEGQPVFEIRIGINSGHVVAGIVGVKKFAYDIWGDTVNLASRMESSGEPGKVNISGSTYELVKNDFVCTYRGKIQAKNKGEVDMYFVTNT